MTHGEHFITETSPATTSQCPAPDLLKSLENRPCSRRTAFPLNPTGFEEIGDHVFPHILTTVRHDC